MKKQFEINGNVSFKKILTTQEVGDRLEITFDDDEIIYLSPFNQNKYYLYPNKIIPISTYKELITRESYRPYILYIKNLLNRKPYSRKQLLTKLQEVKKLDLDTSKEIIKIFEDEYSQDFNRQMCDYLLEKVTQKGYSKTYSYSEFYKNNIYKELADEYLENYEPDIEILFDILDKIYKKDPAFFLENSKKKLIKLGYKYIEIQNILNSYLEINNLAKKDFPKENKTFKTNLSNKNNTKTKRSNTSNNLYKLIDEYYRFTCHSNKKLFTKEKLLHHLLRKGFSYNNIIEEFDNYIENLE